jgi:hypothetical protein
LIITICGIGEYSKNFSDEVFLEVELGLEHVEVGQFGQELDHAFFEDEVVGQAQLGLDERQEVQGVDAGFVVHSDF